MRLTRLLATFAVGAVALVTMGVGTASAATAVTGAPPAGQQLAIQPVHSERCLDVVGAGTAQGTQIKQYSCHFAPHQRFTLELRLAAIDPANNQYAIHPVHNPGFCFDVPGASTADGVVMATYVCHFAPHQRFYFREIRAGQYAIIPVHSEKCLDVSGAGAGDAVPIAQYGCHFAPHQRFYLTPV